MDSRASLASQESTNQTKKMSRKRPLRTCAVSVLGIANQASNRVQAIHGPLGTVAKVVAKFATFASPIIILMRYQWIIMVLLSFVDYLILAVENVIERLYPPSSIVFNKIDDLVIVVETLPEKLDQAMNKLPSSIPSVHQGLDWGLFRAVMMLNFVSSTLTGWRMLKGTREKEIEVDTSCRNDNNHHHHTNEANGAKANNVTKEQLIDSSSKHDAKGGEANNNKNVKSNPSTASTTPLGTPPLGAVMKGSYKEALTKGKKERSESKKEEKKNKKNGKESKTKEKHHSKKEVKSAAADDVNNGGNSEDEIMDLFDSAWLMNRRRNFGKAPRSVSFHG